MTMKGRILAVMVVGLLLASQAHAFNVNNYFFSESNCATYTPQTAPPVAGKAFCLDSTLDSMFVWNGTAFVAANSSGGTISGATIQGNSATSTIQQCGGTVATTGGEITVKAPCAANYTYCSCSVGALPSVPVAGDLCGCQITSTATTTASINSSGTATSTATTAIGYGVTVATTGLAATADINYWGGPN